MALCSETKDLPFSDNLKALGCSILSEDRGLRDKHTGWSNSSPVVLWKKGVNLIQSAVFFLTIVGQLDYRSKCQTKALFTQIIQPNSGKREHDQSRLESGLFNPCSTAGLESGTCK